MNEWINFGLKQNFQIMDFSSYCPKISRSEVVSYAIRISITAAVTYFSFKHILKYLDPCYENCEQRAAELRKRLNLNAKLPLSRHEVQIASMLVFEDRETQWSDIGGYDELMSELEKSVIFPLRLCQQRLDLPTSSLYMPTKGTFYMSSCLTLFKWIVDKDIPMSLWIDDGKSSSNLGVLLYGPPGCGKTLIARAIATMSEINFINFDMSVVTDKWYGESQKVNGVFWRYHLAMRMQMRNL